MKAVRLYSFTTVSNHAFRPDRYLLGKRNSVKLAYGRTTQFLHLLSNSALGLPTDVWMPPDKSIRPQSSQQIVLGYYQGF